MIVPGCRLSGRVETSVKIAMMFESGGIALTGGAAVGMQKGELWGTVAEPIVIRDPDTQEVLGEVSRCGDLYEITGVKARWAHARHVQHWYGPPAEVGAVLARRERYVERENQL